MAVSMTPAMQAEIRILPGNDRCVDCGGTHPQWASVTFGALMCLECSGAHRGMGVHISFVRSVTMDSWNEKQLKLMSNGGNGDLIAFWKKHGVDPRMPHNAKYHEPASELYRERLKARVEGRPLPTEMPARKAAPTSAYDAPGGGSMSAGGFGGGDKKGSEALGGEGEDAYVARQRRLQAEARARMANKFGGGGGMGGVGSNSDYNPATGGYGDEPKFSLAGVGAFLGKAGAGIKDAAAAVNDDDRAAELKARAGSAWGGLKSWGSGLADKVKDLRVDNDGGDLGNFLASNRSSLGSGKQMAGLGSAGFGSDALSRPAHARHDSSNFGSDGFMTADDGGSFGRSSSQNSFSNASRTSSGNALDDRPSPPPRAPPSRSASTPSPGPEPPQPPRADRATSAGLPPGNTPGKAKKLAVDEDDDFFGNFGI